MSYICHLPYAHTCHELTAVVFFIRVHRELTEAASARIGLVSVRQMEVSEAQWDSAREIFYGKLGQDCGMAVEKYQRIKDLLCNWDTLSVPVRRERSGGNHVYWKKKYQVVGEQLCFTIPEGDEASEGDVLSIKQVSHQESMFDDIKMIHCASKRVSKRVPSSFK